MIAGGWLHIYLSDCQCHWLVDSRNWEPWGVGAYVLRNPSWPAPTSPRAPRHWDTRTSCPCSPVSSTQSGQGHARLRNFARREGGFYGDWLALWKTTLLRCIK